MLKRYISERVTMALSDTPVVFIMGPRQAGKTTLCKILTDNNWKYITFDDPVYLNYAKDDPAGFIRSLSNRHIILDEVQRVPEIFVCIKQSVDEDRKPGRFLLTGSANAFLLPRLSDSLAGRIESLRLPPLSESEINQTQPTFLENLLKGKPTHANEIRIRKKLIKRIITGCFPEPLQRENEKRAAIWYKQYIDSLMQRDIQELEHIDNQKAMFHLLQLSMHYSAKLLNLSEMGAKIGLNHITVKKYVSILEHLFLIELLPAWHTNESKRLIKTPKLHVCDTGLICSVRNITSDRLDYSTTDLGFLVESFVFNEIKKQSNFLEEQLNFYHYRDHDKVEVDIIIENGMRECFAIEVKSSGTIGQKDLIGLRRFKDATKEHFKIGILLYDGDDTIDFGGNLFAVPLAAIWA